MPDYTAVSRVRLHPLAVLGLFSGPFRSLGVRPPLVLPRLCVPAYLPPCVNRRLLLSSGVWFHSPQVDFFACEDNGPGRLHSLAVARPSPHPPPLNAIYRN